MEIKFTDLIPDGVIGKLYGKYCFEMNGNLGKEEFSALVRSSELSCVAAGESGALLYAEWDGGCRVPVLGYFYDTEKTLSMLFESLAGRLGARNYSVCLYAGDMAARNLFSMLGFGIMAEKGVRRIEKTEGKTAFDIKTLSRRETEERWDEVWSCTKGIIDRLKESPVFYPGEEFTEDVYRDFYTDGGTSLHAAFEKDRVVGIIESNAEPYDPLGAPSANVGEAYVVPRLRGTGLAAALLAHAEAHEASRGAEYLWVEHGTANPCARGFWNKHFDTVEYEMTREIKL